MRRVCCFAQGIAVFWVCLLAVSCVADAPLYPEDAEDFATALSEVDAKIETLRLYRDDGERSNDGITTDTRIVVRASRGASLRYSLANTDLRLNFLGVSSGFEQVFNIDLPDEVADHVNVVATSPNGTTDTKSLYVRKALMTPLRTIVSGEGNPFQQPEDLAFYGRQTYVVDSATHQLYILDEDFALRQTIGIQIAGTNNNQFDSPSGVFVDIHGRILVADTRNHRVQVFGEDGNHLQTLGTTGVPLFRLSSFNSPTRIAHTVSNDQARGVVVNIYYIVDTGNNRIAAYYDLNGPIARYSSGYIGTGSTSDAPDALNRPLDAAVGPRGEIFVADSGNNRVQVFRPGRGSRPDAELSLTIDDIDDELLPIVPVSLVVNKSSELLYVFDTANEQIHLFGIATNYEINYLRSLDVGGGGDLDFNQAFVMRSQFRRMGFIDQFGGQRRIQFFNTEDYSTEEFVLLISVSTNLFGIVNNTGDPDDFVTTDNRIRISAPKGSAVYYRHPFAVPVEGTEQIDDNVYKTYLTFNAPGTPVDYALNMPFRIAQLTGTATEEEEVPPIRFGFELGSVSEEVDVEFDYRLAVFHQRLEMSFGAPTSNEAGLNPEPGDLYKAYGVATMDLQGNLFFADSLEHVVYLRIGRAASQENFSSSSINLIPYAGNAFGHRGTIGRDGGSDGFGGRFNHPADIAVDANGYVYVADTDNHRVQIISPFMEVTTLGRTGIRSTRNDGFDKPHGLAVDSRGVLYVADTDNHRIQIYDTNWEYTKTIGQAGQSNSQKDRFNQPTGVSVDRNDNVYIADTGNSRVQVFDREGRFVQTISNSLMNSPADVAVDNNQNVYVTMYGNNRILVFSSGGAMFTALDGREGNASGTSILRPKSLFFDSTGEFLYVTEFASSRTEARSLTVFKISQQDNSP